MGSWTFLSCSASYPKENLKEAVQTLFRKELGVAVDAELVGKTLYVSFKLDNLVSQNLELPKEVVKKLEDAMLSITRISLSTDADIETTVVEAKDPKWGVQTNIVRRMHDLKGLLYWTVSKGDFDERLVLETGKMIESGSRDWHDISLPEFMGRWVASRISMGTRANPFLSVLLGIEKMSAHLDPSNQSLILSLEGTSPFHLSTSSSTINQELLKNSICEQMSEIELKYPVSRAAANFRDPNWVRWVRVQDIDGKEVLEIPSSEWRSEKFKNKKRREE